MYFSYDPEDGFELHKTRDEAKKRADDSLELYRDEAYEGWHEQTCELCWGKLIEKAAVTRCEKAPSDSDFDEILDFDLTPIKKKD